LGISLVNSRRLVIGSIGVQTNLRAEFCNANTRIAGATLKQSSGTLPTRKLESIEIRSMRFSFGTSCRLTKDSASASALPGGSGYSGGSFDIVGDYGNWWSATEDIASNAYIRYMYYNYANVDRDLDDKTGLLSVRCAQDCTSEPGFTGCKDFQDNNTPVNPLILVQTISPQTPNHRRTHNDG
jgi:hypothetical protein